VSSRLPLEDLLGLPAQQLVGEPLERLAHHDESAVAAACTEVEVRQPALTPAVSPLGGQHDEVERAHRLHLAPRLTATAGLVRRRCRLHHDALVTRG
jgi:hypothetical protein